MTSTHESLFDTQIEAAILRRIGGHADASLTRSIVDMAAGTPQARALPAIGRGRLRVAAGLAAAAVVAIGLGLVATGSVPKVPPVPPATPRAVVAQPTASPGEPSPTATSLETCATDTAAVLTGDAMPPADVAPVSVPAGVLQLGVYLTSQDGASQADVWAASVGDATRIASIVGPGINVTNVEDVSADGSLALIQLGVVHGGLPGPMCDDLYVVRTDGSGATRLTRNGANQHASEGSFSPDGRYVAYRDEDRFAGPPRVSVIDLQGDLTPRGSPCVGDGGEVHARWAPSGDRLAVVCGGTVMLAAVDPSQPTGLGHVSALELPAAGPGTAARDDAFVDARWLDATHLLDVRARSGASSNGPIDLRTITFDTPDMPANGTSSKPLTVEPWLADAGFSTGIALAPDGHTFAVLADPKASDFSGDSLGLYVVDARTGHAQVFAGWPAEEPGWSADSRTLSYTTSAAAFPS